MGMIDRYKKAGGFVQLLNLIETCGPAKQEKFLAIVHQEDPNWANAIKKKMLTIERILSWSDDTLAEVFAHVQDLTLATALFGLGEDLKARLFKYFSHAQQRRIQDIMDEKKPTPAEISATYVKIIEEVRHRIKEGYIKMDKIDAGLVIEEDIEDLLAQGVSFGNDYTPAGSSANGGPTVEESFAAPESAGTPASGGEYVPPSVASTEMASLKKKVQLLSQENSQLRQEIKVLKGKLEQIKKIA